MTATSFFSDQECRDVGFSEPMIRTLRKIADLADAIDRLGTVETTAATLNTQLDTTNLTLGTLNTRVGAIELLEPFVRQGQTAAWANATGTVSRATFASYAGQTVSNPPTQAEVQAIDDYVKLLSQRVAGLVNDLRSIGALT